MSTSSAKSPSAGGLSTQAQAGQSACRPQVQTQPAIRTHPQATGPRVLLVDDEPAPLELARDACAHCLPNAQLVGFTNPKQALAHAAVHPPDIALLDIKMRTMTGLDLARHLKGINPRVNIIFVTGFSEYAIQAVDLHASGYVTKPVTPRKLQPALDNLLFPPKRQLSGCRAQTFGNFEFFVNGKPVHFARSKAKELLALLVDRRGASLTTEQMATYLFEDRNYDRSVKNQLMPIIRCLQDGLQKAGAGNVLLRSWGHLAVDTGTFTCDAYEFDQGDPVAINSFKGEYMAQYSWAEERVGLFMW